MTDPSKAVAGLVAWIDQPDLAAQRAQVLRLAASGRPAVLVDAVTRMSGRGVPSPPPGWEAQARALLVATTSDSTALQRFRRVCFAEAAQLLRQRPHWVRHDQPELPGTAGVRRHGPPPRLQGCRGRTVRWRPAPAP